MPHLTSNPEDKSRFLCIYPSYVNSKKILAEDRLILVEKAVENPSCSEIGDVLTAPRLNVLVECSYSNNKIYLREWNRDVQFSGRVGVQLKLQDGSLCQEKFSFGSMHTKAFTPAGMCF
ncbi:signal recognition particle 19 kDa protein-like [Misgurnus anguillicaudatus]|uniref:signal recognition particle 19 kDa protein-like n=1 Tax=Misgurnus anguillicaudatus TaxID=75329 RepID=UPI003CCF2308